MLLASVWVACTRRRAGEEHHRRQRDDERGHVEGVVQRPLNVPMAPPTARNARMPAGISKPVPCGIPPSPVITDAPTTLAMAMIESPTGRFPRRSARRSGLWRRPAAAPSNLKTSSSVSMGDLGRCGHIPGTETGQGGGRIFGGAARSQAAAPAPSGARAMQSSARDIAKSGCRRCGTTPLMPTRIAA